MTASDVPIELVESRSPQHPLDVVASVPAADAAAVQRALETARAAQREWAAATPLERAAALSGAAGAVEAAAAELVALGVREVGKPVGEMAGEVARGVAILRYYAGGCLDPDGETLPAAGGILLLARRRPHGVAGCITPWNFPVAIPLWKLAPALAYGNAVLLKPAPAATATAMRLGELVGAHLPAGLLAVLPGGAATGQAVLGAVDALSFTGSAAVGAALATDAVRRGIPVQAEMGGQNPSVVLEDADHETAASIIAGAAMGYAGQKCTATSRVVVTGDAAGFVDALVAAVERLRVGDPGAAATVVGPVITETARRAVVAGADAVTAAGGRVLTGGRSLARDGFFVAPTVVGGIDPSHRVAQEEIFGPIVAVLPARDLEEAIAFANGVRYGLAAALFTRDLDRALGVLPRLEAGLVRVNAPTSGVDLYAPFGGVKDSSIGPREQGKAAREFFTWTQTATIAPAGGS